MDDAGSTREDVKAEGEVLQKIEKMQEEGQDICKCRSTNAIKNQLTINSRHCPQGYGRGDCYGC